MNAEKFTLITGASSGIGNAFANICAKKKMNLALVALPGTGLPEIADQLSLEFGVQVKYCELDLTKTNAANAVYQWCRNEGIIVNYLVNNAGMGHSGWFATSCMAYNFSMMHLNMGALVSLSHKFIPELRKVHRSGILNVGSMASWFPVPNKVLYAATKSFVLSFSTSLRKELKSQGINVSCLCPGATPTSKEVMERIRNGGWLHRLFSNSPMKVAAKAMDQFLMGRSIIIPNPADRIVLWLSRLIPLRLRILLTGSIMGFNGKAPVKASIALKPRQYFSSIRKSIFP